MSHVPGIEASESAPPLPPAKKRRGRPPKNANAAALRPTTAFSNATDSRPKPKLKLNFKKAKLTPPKHVADDTDGDTIAVSHKFKALGVPDTAYSQFNNLEMVDKQVDNSRQARNNAATNRLWGGKGKQPARDVVSGTSAAAANSHNDRDVEILEIDDEPVDEGSIHSSDVDPAEFEDDYNPADDDDEVKSHISIASSRDENGDKEKAYGDFDGERPWKVQGFDKKTRYTWELMYCNLVTRIADLEFAEDIQREKDNEMLRYLQDFPLDQWVVAKADAERAYFDMLERARWRKLGIRIYSSSRVPGVFPNGFLRADDSMPPHLLLTNSTVPNPSIYNPSMRPPSGFLPQTPPHHTPPQQILRSQLNAHPLNGQSRFGNSVPYQPTVQIAQLPPGQYPLVPAGMGLQPSYHQHLGCSMHQSQTSAFVPNMPSPHVSEAQNAKPGRKKQMSSPAGDVRVLTRIPPYAKIEKPMPRPELNKTGKKNMRRQAECDEFPWHRQGIDFMKARAEATWDISGYDQNILNAMAEVRKKNLPVIAKLDEELAEKQRKQRANRALKKKGLSAETESSEMEDGRPRSRTGPKGNKENVGGDPYYGGQFSFASDADQAKALALHCKSPTEVIERAENGQIDWELTKDIIICWNPTKRGTTQELEQARFRVWDTLITRKQLAESVILTKRAAECIIDFCPDLIWRETLLRIVSEGGCGNKDVRDRLSYNGCHADKATITKRIASALGQKQLNAVKKRDEKDDEEDDEDCEDKPTKKGRRRGPHAKGRHERYGVGEEEWHHQNQLDYNAYIAFFGKRRGHIPMGAKRKKLRQNGDEIGHPSSSKRPRTGFDFDAPSPPSTDATQDMLELDDEGDGTESGEEEAVVVTEAADDNDDAMSAQDSDVLDGIEH